MNHALHNVQRPKNLPATVSRMLVIDGHVYLLVSYPLLLRADFKAEAISGDTKVLNESGKEIPLPKK
jgi:hypothetical protein